MTYANYEQKSVWIKYDFGNELARKWFGDSVINALPKITRGKNKGKPKGVLEWTKCHSGGWVRTYTGGYVLRPGVHFKRITLDGNTIYKDPRDLTKDREGTMQSGWVGAGCEFEPDRALECVSSC